MKTLAVLLTLSACSPTQTDIATSTSTVASERTWWWLCWSNEDIAQPAYPDEDWPHRPACQTPELVTWPGRKVTITIEPEAEIYRAEILAAANRWNAWAGRGVFVYAPNGRVKITVGDLPWFAAGMAQHYKHRGALFANVGLAQHLKDPYHVALHEFGHVLGFGHDSAEVDNSVMHPAGKNNAITDLDLVALRQRYGPR